MAGVLGLTIVISRDALIIGLIIDVIGAALIYHAARRFQLARGVPPWRLPAGAWSLIFFLFTWIGLLLFVIATFTTRYSPYGAGGTTTGGTAAGGHGDGGAMPLPPAQPMPIAGWYPDPSRRHELRYWDGKGWTAHVRDGAVQATDGG